MEKKTGLAMTMTPLTVMCTPKVRQKTFGVYYVKKKKESPSKLSLLHAYDRRWFKFQSYFKEVWY